MIMIVDGEKMLIVGYFYTLLRGWYGVWGPELD